MKSKKYARITLEEGDGATDSIHSLTYYDENNDSDVSLEHVCAVLIEDKQISWNVLAKLVELDMAEKTSKT